MKAEIVSIGTELLLGEITDTNASYLASQLPLLGIDLLWVTQVGDNLERLRECLEQAWGRSDIVLTTGGSGSHRGRHYPRGHRSDAWREVSVDAELERRLQGAFLSPRLPYAREQYQAGRTHPLSKGDPQHVGHRAGLVGGKRTRETGRTKNFNRHARPAIGDAPHVGDGRSGAAEGDSTGRSYNITDYKDPGHDRIGAPPRW